MLKQEKRRAAEAEAALARHPEGSPSSGGAGAVPLAGGRNADSGIQLESSIRGSERSTLQDSRESSAVCCKEYV